MKAKYHVRILTADDVDIYRIIRLKALQTDPDSFGGVYEEEVLYNDAEYKAYLDKIITFGVFYEDEIIGSVGLKPEALTKIKHDARVLGLYVAPEHRGQGAGSLLFNYMIEYAKNRVLQLSLYCISVSHGAIKFYEKHGFITTGIYPRSLKSGDEFYDSNMMFLKLD